ncbi:glutamine abc transporter, glutamine-binding protein [Heliomicrobium modesticaldum Ice1]|uniref:Glutamine abc transporter, glutamine-binding protein n=1 Tax=Heliobacterium modesticaldum (strain ATCC 51547 / Ice1) TaxID=498761 RepID=B0TGZ1_HELMI|nr:basic amino acid ABC transporter substrate-binding protein [Heliomicrobium modesticaldum]ABZ83316.1 glutamine abc transporter, glutamine-binding protein [Heliomicrobium modesticaldum Ice1]
MKKWVKTGLMGMLALGMLITAAGCGGGEKAAQAPTGDKSSAKKTIKVATDAAYAPFEWKDEKGEIVGFDIDLIKAVGKELNADIELIDTPFDGIIAALTNKNVDMLISAMTITEKRKESIDFSKPYFVAVQAIAVKEGSPVKKFDDIKGLKVGVQNSTTGQYVVEKLLGEKSDKIFRYDTTPMAMNMLSNGDVDVVVADKPVVQHFLKNNPNAKMTLIDDASFEKEEYGIAVRKGETELLKQVNDALDKLEKSGKIKEISEKYLTGK